MDSGVSPDDFLSVYDIVFGHAINNAMVPGKVEQILLIIDANNLKLW